MGSSHRDQHPDSLLVLSPLDGFDILHLYRSHIVDTLVGFEILEIKANASKVNTQSSEHIVDGYIRFATVTQAEKAYALFNHAQLSNRHCLEFLYYDIASPSAAIEITAVVHCFSLREWIDAVYDACRLFGPLIKCKNTTCNPEKETLAARVQYLSQEDADKAMSSLKQIHLHGQPIAITKHKQAMKKIKQSVRQLKPSMDLCNLYIKHLNPALDSTGLFNLFSRFGRIISARVMDDPATGKSKCFGFVSYSHPAEAAVALLEMDGYDNTLLSSHNRKPHRHRRYILRITFHEPRIPRSESDHIDQISKLLAASPQLAKHFSFDPPQATPSQQPNYFAYPVVYYPYLLFSRPYMIPYGVPTVTYSSPLAPHASFSAPITDINDGRQKLISAIIQAVSTSQTANAEEIANHLMTTLNRKERCLCLFNQDYLRRQIRQTMSPNPKDCI